MPNSEAGTGEWMRFPLAWKILLWFFFNVIFVCGVAAIVAQVYLHLRVDALLAGRADERLQTLAVRIANGIDRQPVTQWAPVLDRFAADYQVQIGVFLNDDGRLVTGRIDPLPAPVVVRLTDSGRPLEQRLRRGPPPRDDFGGDGPPPPPPDRPPPAPRDKFVMRAGSPPAYWIGIRTRLIDVSGAPFGPTTVMIKADSLSSGGLLFDYKPLLLAGAAVLFCSVLFWIPLVRGITRSIRQMTGAAGAIAQGQFDVQVPMRRSDELGRLGVSLNHMAARLREFVTGQKRFLGDIAHELCSPLARMEMALGVLEQRTDETQSSYVEDVREEVRHMSALVSELLSFSKAGMGGKTVELKPMALLALVSRAVSREAHEKGCVVVDVPASLQVLAEPELLSRAIGNVVRNAVRYANPVSVGGDEHEGREYSFRPMLLADGRAAGPITISALERGEEVILTVADCGPGVPEAALHRLFDPFFRPEAARTREGGGAGLGLAIVKSCMEACGGTVAAHNAKPSGLLVEFRLRRVQ